MQEQFQNEDSLSSLMYRAQQGDNHAYSVLFTKVTPMLRSFISQKISNPDDMEDIVQEILISLHKAGHTYDANRPFEVWMYTIARYRLNDHLRAYYKNMSLKEKIQVEYQHFTGDLDVTPDMEIDESINELIDALPEKQKLIVTMMKVEGYTAKETAEKLNMTETAVKVAAHRVYKKLAEQIRRKEELTDGN
ncbi:MAG: sigma-70 family RNA polymerase sigma factor [Gammaproteobacteria bacterium]|nr:sigma-70 family RNA polymerase sigma factor [Gammaproteobacteria bacterium]